MTNKEYFGALLFVFCSSTAAGGLVFSSEVGDWGNIKFIFGVMGASISLLFFIKEAVKNK